MQATLLASLVHVPLSAYLLSSSLGVVGVAVAYCLSRSVELAAMLLGLRTQLRVPRGAKRPSARSIFSIGLTTAIERILDMAAFAMVPLLLSLKDPIAVAAHQVTLQLSQLSFLPLVALSEAVSILISQTQGSRLRGLARAIARDGYLATFCYAAILAGLFFAIPERLIGLFTKDHAVILAGANALRVAALLQLVNSSYAVTKGILRGLSHFDLVAWVAVACAWGVTPPLTYYLGVHLGFGAAGAWTALVIEVAVGLALLRRVSRRLLQRD
jgi:MATE family multidrug resistance protein